MPNNIKDKGLRYLKVLFVLVLTVGISVTVYVYLLVKSQNEKFLLQETDTVAQLLDVHTACSLHGDASDLDNPQYITLKEKLQGAVKVNPNIRFIYLLGQKKERIFYYADSEPEDSKEYSPPGQVYDEASPALRSVFKNKEPVTEGPIRDRWGVWISAFVPVTDKATGAVLSVVGMDIDAYGLIWASIANSAMPALATMILAILLTIYYFLRKRELQRIAMKAESVSITSHEIRSTLTGMAWGTELLKEKIEKKLDDEENELLNRIKNSSDNLLGTVNDLLDLHALESDPRKAPAQAIDICPILRSSLLNLELTARQKGIGLDFISNTKGVCIVADKEKIRRMFNNLISNAIKYSKPDTHVSVTCEEGRTSFVFKVTDQGIGIPEEDYQKIFQGFYRSKNAKDQTNQGTGMGLYYVKMIVEAFHGRIWVKSKVGKGTTFFVEFQRCPDPTNGSTHSAVSMAQKPKHA